MDNKVTISKKINIYWKENRSGFYMANKKEISPEPRLIGSADSSVKRMLARGEEQAMTMSTIIGESPNSQEWQKKLTNYWHSLSVPIPPSGKELEIGFEYDYNTGDEQRKSYISKLTNVKDSNDLAKYVEDKVEEQDKYKYGMPINPEDYMLYRYCLVYRFVANHINDIDKSVKIKFYLFSKAERDKLRKEKYNVKKQVTVKWLEVIKDPDRLMDLLYTIGKGNEAEKLKEDFDKEQLLNTWAEANPNEFLKLVDDKNIKTRGYIERLIDSGILKRLPNSSIIVDANEPDVTVGDNMDSAINFFSNAERNKVKLNEFKTRYNTLKKK